MLNEIEEGWKLNFVWEIYLLNLKNKCQALPCVLISPCKNGATCTNDNLGGYSCTCATGYTGTNCQYGK